MKPAFSKLFFSLGVLSLVGSFVIVSVGHAEIRLFNFFGTSSSSNAVLPTEQVRVVSQQDQVVDAVKNAAPAVVSVIITKDLPKIEIDDSDVSQEFPFNDPFFRNFRMEIPRLRQNGTQQTEVGGGTAFFVSSDGLLMTNRHVVEDANAQYTVLLSDGRKLPATVAGLDNTNDIALLRVQGSNFPALQIASNDDLNLGQTVIAIGNALGEFRNTVSVGVVSGLERSIIAGGAQSGPERLDRIIQTDAAINEGNSGGPLLDIFGNVIGMNSAIAGNAQSIGFALPANELRRVLSNFQKNGRIVQTYLGVRYVQITPELKQEKKLAAEEGVLIAKGDSDEPAILPGSPAEKAGLRENDIILEADGQALTDNVSLQQIIVNKAPGDSLHLKISREGKTQDIVATLAEMKQ